MANLRHLEKKISGCVFFFFLAKLTIFGRQVHLAELRLLAQKNFFMVDHFFFFFFLARLTIFGRQVHFAVLRLLAKIFFLGWIIFFKARLTIFCRQDHLADLRLFNFLGWANKPNFSE